MPQTRRGTEYTIHEDSNATKLYGIADQAKNIPNRPLMVYCHGAGGAYDQFASLAAWRSTRDWLIDNGWAWVESDGGGPTSWGNTAARQSYRDATEWAMEHLDVSDIVVLGRSMGGIVSYWTYLYDPIVSPKATGLIVNAGTTDLYQRVRLKAPGAIFDAYGVSNLEAFDTASQGHDPMTFPTSDWEGKSVLQVCGTADTSVPPDVHGQAWLQKYGESLNGNAALDLVQGGDHGTHGPYSRVQSMSKYFASRTTYGLPRLAFGNRYYNTIPTTLAGE